jgi:hypothetical protein
MITRLLASFCVFTILAAGDVSADAPLFSSHDVLDLTIPLDFKNLCRPREDPDCDYTATVLEYIDEHGQALSIPIEIKIRGGWRSLTQNCSAPLLFVRFDQDKTKDTPFEGQTMLPLTTHCGQGVSLEAAQTRVRPSQWEQYLLKEYLAHLLYNEITELSIKARLVRMTYPNPNKRGQKIKNYAFFTEHFESVAARNDDEVLARHSFDPDKLDMDAANLVALFQFMIGNTDWSIVRERNIVLLQDTDGKQLPLPFDFDMSGLVNANYAGPAPKLPIDAVTERYYLGFCSQDASWEALLERYSASQAAILSRIDEIPGLNKQSIGSSRRFLEKFFEILQSEKLRNREFADHCQPWPPGPDDHTTPLD